MLRVHFCLLKTIHFDFTDLAVPILSDLIADILGLAPEVDLFDKGCMVNILVIVDDIFNINLITIFVLVKGNYSVVVKESKIINLGMVNFDANITDDGE